MKREEIHIRDPFVLPYNGTYYLFGSGKPNGVLTDQKEQFWCYTSKDLKEWSNPTLCFEWFEGFWADKNFWAPEVHAYNGKFYMFATFYDGKTRATQALVADVPQGPYKVWSEPLTPQGQMCLDGTLYVENGTPYLVYCHEWIQVGDGEIAAVPLEKDLSKAAGEPTILFRASQSGWAQPIDADSHHGTVTDGPWLVKDGEKLILFWSSFRYGSYAVGMALSQSGSVLGPWKHLDNLLFEKDGGHGMMFTSFDETQYFVLHHPNRSPSERPCFFRVKKAHVGYSLCGE